MFILASSSPRRSDILRRMGASFTVLPSRYEEHNDRPLSPEDLVTAQARGKALDVAERAGKDTAVLGADTVVVLNGAVLGKPGDEEAAKEMLRRLSGRVHEVLTGVALVYEGRIASRLGRTKVSFRMLSEEEIEDYVATGEPLDKAGAYGIQGGGGAFVAHLDGSRSNVIGLPEELVPVLFREMGVPFP